MLELIVPEEGTAELHVEVIASGPQGPPGDSPCIGENGNWWIGGEDTGVPAQGGGTETDDHRRLMHRDAVNQHPIQAIEGLQEVLEALPYAMTEEELRHILMGVKKHGR